MKKKFFIILIGLTFGLGLWWNNYLKASSLIDPPQLEPGWPVVMDSNVRTSTCLGDIDGDGELEIVVGTDGWNGSFYAESLYAFNHDGTIVEGWPVFTENGGITNAPALGDINGDGQLEIVVSTNSQVFVFNGHGEVLAGWPVELGYNFSGPSLGDIDGDGKLEILVTADKIYAFNEDGSVVDGWPIGDFSGEKRLVPVIGDVDGDGELEIVVAVGSTRENTGTLSVMNPDGTNLPGWPIERNYVFKKPSLGDIDSDGELEIVVSSYGGYEQERIQAFERDGSLVSGWPVLIYNTGFVGNPVLGDIDGDDRLEVVMTTSNKIYVLNDDGSILPDWPIDMDDDNLNSPALADLDNDNKLEIIFGSYGYYSAGKLYALNEDASAVEGWPINNLNTTSSPTIADFDNDGTTEIIAGTFAINGTFGHVYAWGYNSTPTGKIMWPTFAGNNQRTSLYGQYVPEYYANIQTAIEVANPGETIYVSNGIYREQIVMKETVDIIGENPHRTIIDAEDASGAVIIGADDSLFTKFTVLGGQTGIYCPFSSFTVKNNIIRDNSYSGISTAKQKNPTIINNTIVENNNYGIFLDWPVNPTIKNNIISNNGSGIFVVDTFLEPEHLTYNDVWGNLNKDYFGSRPGEGSISEDPKFEDDSNEDFHLGPGSPCIDAGDPNSPPDPDLTRADMGALYFHQQQLIAQRRNPILPTPPPTYQEGWPVSVGGPIGRSSATVGDIDPSYPGLELLIGAQLENTMDGAMYAFHADGTLVSGWPKESFYDLAKSSATLGDVDGDGDLEVVFGSGSQIYVSHGNGDLLEGWPVDLHDYLITSTTPSLSDIDGDGDLEIILPRDLHIYAWHGNGQLVDGWPVQVSGYLWGVFDRTSAAIGDLDPDYPGLEVVAISAYVEYLYAPQVVQHVYCYHADGTESWNYRRILYGVNIDEALDADSSPVLGDINNDGFLEVVVGLGGKLYVLDRYGDVLPGWPADVDELMGSTPALGDIDRDGEIEIVVGCKNDGPPDDTLFAFNADGSLLDGWPVETVGSIQSSPVLGDIDGDGVMEIVVGSEDYNLYAFNSDGTQVAHWPLSTNGSVKSSPALGDIDRDGIIEVVVGSTDGNVYAWDLGVPYRPEQQEWPMFQHDERHTGLYSYP